MSADGVTAAATAVAALLAAWAAWSARKAAKASQVSASAAETSARASVELVALERERFDLEKASSDPAELRVSHRPTKQFRRLYLIVSNAGPAAARDVVVHWLDAESHEAHEAIDPTTLKAARLAPDEEMMARAWVPSSDQLAFEVRMSWNDSRGPQERTQRIDISV